MKKRRLPDWLVKKYAPNEHIHELKALLRGVKLHTVCESARCPNLGECFAKSIATFMILGNICTRTCGFCAVNKGEPAPLDLDEPQRVAQASLKLGLNYVVITSVTRDDLADGGAGQFVATVKAIRDLLPTAKIEVLTPDFAGNCEAITQIAKIAPDVYNHNVETVPQLYEQVRPQAHYQRSLNLLKMVKQINSDIKTKSGLMLGLGETKEQVLKVLRDLRDFGCDLLTIGQYLQPTRNSLVVQRYVPPQEFDYYKNVAQEMGFEQIMSQPFARSSYHASEINHQP